jgi:hypothetical protein
MTILPDGPLSTEVFRQPPTLDVLPSGAFIL